MPNPKPESVGPGEGREWWPRANDVSRPTMTVYAPQGPQHRRGVVVFPGGGYQFLAMDLEGTEICDWLTSRGITCVLLKYRVPGSGPWWDDAEPTARLPEGADSAAGRALAGGCLRDGWKANSGKRSPCQSGNRSISAPLASRLL
jgi:hypothetical protein